MFSTFFNSLKSIVVLYNVDITLMSSRWLLNAFESAKKSPSKTQVQNILG